MMLPKILLVEDHAVVQQTVREILHQVHPDALIDVRSDIRNGLSAMKTSAYALVVSDLGFDGQIRFDLLEACRQQRVPCVVLTGYVNQESVKKALDLGAAGYILKTSPLDVLRYGFAHLDPLNPFLCPHTREVLERSRHEEFFEAPRLTLMEEEALKMTIEGCDLNEIAERMGKSFHTVRAYRRDMLKKNNCTLPTLIKRYLAYHP